MEILVPYTISPALEFIRIAFQFFTLQTVCLFVTRAYIIYLIYRTI